MVLGEDGLYMAFELLLAHVKLIFTCELWIANCWSAGLKEERGAWPLATRKKDSLQYGYGAIVLNDNGLLKSWVSPVRKNIYKQ